jgi:hypothetical protein
MLDLSKRVPDWDMNEAWYLGHIIVLYVLGVAVFLRVNPLLRMHILYNFIISLVLEATIKQLFSINLKN